MKKLLLATHNQAKLKYFRILLGDLDLELLNLDSFNISESPIEDGGSEKNNALIKARFCANRSNCLSLGDDAGMYIDALGGEPGVESRRWAGTFSDDVTDELWLEYFMMRMKDVPNAKRTGYFQVCRALVNVDGREWTWSIKRNFTVAMEPNWDLYEKGWPMSTVCIDSQFNKPWSRLDINEKIIAERCVTMEMEKIINEIYK